MCLSLHCELVTVKLDSALADHHAHYKSYLLTYFLGHEASANLELVDKFCYLGDTLSVDGDADAAVEARFKLDGINSGSWYQCLPIRIYH